MSIIETMKSHPYIMGGAALGTVVIVLMVTGKGAATPGTSVAVTGGIPTADGAYAAAQASVANAQIGADLQRSNITGAIEIAHLQSETLVRRDEIAASVKLAETDAAADVAMRAYDTQRAVALVGLQVQQAIAEGQQETQRYIVERQSGERLAEIDATRRMAESNSAAIVAQANANRDALIRINELNAQTAQHTADLQATVAAHQIDANAQAAVDAAAASANAIADAERSRGIAAQYNYLTAEKANSSQQLLTTFFAAQNQNRWF